MFDVSAGSPCRSIISSSLDSGLRLFGAVEDDDRIASLISRYQAALETAAAWRLHERDWTSDEVRAWLDERTLVGGRGWVENRVRFISAADRAVLMWSYWHGEPTVSSAIHAVEEPQSRAFVQYLYGRLHSVDTVGMFPG